MTMRVHSSVRICSVRSNLTYVLLYPILIVIASRVFCSSHDMEVTSDDVMDYRTVLGEHYCGTHVHGGIGMAEEVEVTNWSPSRALR